MARTVKNNFQEGDAYEKMQFYYHPDHLGSSSYITNLDGEVVQHVEYVPFGEVFIEERNNIWNTPYLFNAKEFDEETGLYYYGARYYEPRLSVWMTTDPLQEEYPNITTYGFCHNNPLILIDPDGMGDYFNEKGIWLGSDGKNDNKGFAAQNVSKSKSGLVASYLGDLLKKETGISALKHIQQKMLDVAKERVFDTSKSISEIAYELGFQYPQHFSRWFKKMAGCTPTEYRTTN